MPNYFDETPAQAHLAVLMCMYAPTQMGIGSGSSKVSLMNSMKKFEFTLLIRTLRGTRY